MKGNDLDIERLRRDIVFQETLLGHPFTFHTTWGLFSPKGIDAGTRLLLEHLEVAPDERALDLGCGYFFHDIHQRLEPGGRFYVVVITGLRQFIARSFEEVFGNHRKIKQGKSYTVAMAESGTRRSHEGSPAAPPGSDRPLPRSPASPLSKPHLHHPGNGEVRRSGNSQSQVHCRRSSAYRDRVSSCHSAGPIPVAGCSRRARQE